MPWGPSVAGAGLIVKVVGLGAYALKLLLLAALLSLFETAIAKMRVFRVPEFLGVALMLGLLGTILLFVSRAPH